MRESGGLTSKQLRGLPGEGAVSGDTLFDGRLRCRQPEKGYRFSIDSLLLAHFCRPTPGDTILDLGAGCGVVGLVLYFRHAPAHSLRIVCLELQGRPARLAGQNIRENGFQDGMQVVQGDLRRISSFLKAETMDKVICNPPYRRKGSGRVNPGTEEALARHEIAATLDDVARAAFHAVKNRGRVFLIYPASRAAALLHGLERRRLTPKRLQPVYGYPQAGCASMVLVEAMKNGGEGMEFLSPLYIYDAPDGPYSRAIRKCIRG